MFVETFVGYACVKYFLHSVVATKLGRWLKIKLKQLKEGGKHPVLTAEVPVVLYQVIAS